MPTSSTRTSEREFHRSRCIAWLIVALATLVFALIIIFAGFRNAEAQHSLFSSSRLDCIEQKILENDAEIKNYGFSERFDLDGIMDMGIGKDFFFAAYPDDGELLYFPKSDGCSLSAGNLSDLGLNLDLKSDKAVWVDYCGARYLAVSRFIESEHFGGMAVVAMNYFDASSFWPFLSFSILVFALLAALTVYYVLQLRSEGTAENRDSTRHKSLLLIAACSVFFFVFSVYTARLFDIDAVNSELSGSDEFIQGLTETRTLKNAIEYDGVFDECLEVADELRENLETHGSSMFDPSESETFIYRQPDENGSIAACPDYLGNPTRSVIRSSYLQSLADQYSLDSIAIYDSNGRRIATTDGEWNHVLPLEPLDDPNDESYFWHLILDRESKSYLGQYNGEMTCARFIDLFPYDDDGLTLFGNRDDENVDEEFGLLVFTFPCPSYYKPYDKVFTGICDDAEKMLLSKTAFFACSEDEQYYEFKSSSLPAEYQSSLGMDDAETCFGGNYMGFATVKGEKHLLTCRKVTLNSALDGEVEKYIACYTPMSVVNGNHTLLRWFIPFTLLTAALLMFAAALSSRFSAERLRAMATAYAGKKSMRHDEELPYQQSNPEDRLFALLKSATDIIIIIFAVCFLVSLKRSDNPSVLRHILNGSWAHGINLFSFTAFVLTVLCVATLNSVLSAVYSIASRYLSAKTCTMLKLIVSIIKYGCVLFCIFYLLYLLGMDVKTVLTSLGAFSILVGLAAQSLIKDFISGFFVLIEGTYKIGDIVQIDGYTGKVREIGLRSTKFEDKSGNITVINNSNITQLVNLSAKHSTVRLEFPVPIGTHLERLEEIFTEEQPAIENSLGDTLLGHIRYEGIVSTDVSQKTCQVRFSADCIETDRGSLKHAMAKELAKLLEKYPEI